VSAGAWLRRAASRVRSGVRLAPPASATDAAPATARGWFRRASARERSRWAQRALDWPLVNYLEGSVWLLVAVTLAVSYYGSYDNLVDVLAALGYAIGPRHVVPIALDAPLTCSVIGQFLLARWKSPAVKRWRLFVVTLITAPLSLAGNALHGALRFPVQGDPSLDLGLLDLSRPEVVIRLVAAMVPGIGIILAVAVTELVLRERARLEELRQPGPDLAGPVEGATSAPARLPAARSPGSDHVASRRSDSGGITSDAPAAGHPAARRPAAEVLAMVRSARERLTVELGREPKDEEVAARVSADGHPITASRVRTYLAQLRSEERERPAPDVSAEEVVAWHAR
jgi:hypothetical protein